MPHDASCRWTSVKYRFVAIALHYIISRNFVPETVYEAAQIVNVTGRSCAPYSEADRQINMTGIPGRVPLEFILQIDLQCLVWYTENNFCFMMVWNMVLCSVGMDARWLSKGHVPWHFLLADQYGPGLWFNKPGSESHRKFSLQWSMNNCDEQAFKHCLEKPNILALHINPTGQYSEIWKQLIVFIQYCVPARPSMCLSCDQYSSIWCVVCGSVQVCQCTLA